MFNYQDFRANPVIDRLAGKAIWTVSTRDKCPVDIFEYVTFHKLRGAAYKNELSLATLDHVSELFPDAANRACYLNAQTEGIMVLDIEPKCPPAVRDRLLRFPCLYAEKSMSGKGYHLLMKVPAMILRAYPAAAAKPVLKHVQGWYEFLLDHYVTFTGNQVECGGHDTQEFLAVFKSLAENQCESRDSVQTEAPDIRHSEKYEADQLLSKAIEILSSDRNPYNKTPADFGNDQSHYEFKLAENRYVWLQRLMEDQGFAKGRELTDDEIVWVLYKTAQALIPYRPKHDHPLNGMPFLMYQCYKAYSRKKPKPPPDPNEDDGELTEGGEA